VIFYEDYQNNLQGTARSIREFVDQEPVAEDDDELQPFRELPNYDDHYTDRQREAIAKLVKAVAIPETWNLLQRYFP